MLQRKQKTCSICGEIGHNKLTCSHKTIQDMKPTQTIITEELVLPPKREQLLQDIQDKQDYGISSELFRIWLPYRKHIKLKEVCCLVNQKIHKDNILLYLDISQMIDEYY